MFGGSVTTEDKQSGYIHTFWRRFHNDGKISPICWGGGGEVHSLALSLFLPSKAKFTCYNQHNANITNILGFRDGLCKQNSFPNPFFLLAVADLRV
jgi:hypothetical protein